ncbi:MAG: DNA repair protein RadC [Proteobacteria bacterium]|nr:DNA repair protein RadC [Pseudomonadota bacterium]
MLKEKNLSYTAGHRSRLRQKFRETRLVDYEALELVLTYAVPRVDVKPMARDLMAKFGGLHQIFAASFEELEGIRGIGESAAVLLKLFDDLKSRDYVATLKDAPIFHNVGILQNHLKTEFGGKMIEEFHILYLDASYKLIEENTHSVGTIDHSSVYPREILKHALNLNARSVILAHNHPSGDTMFSSEDIETTERIRDKLIDNDIEFFDHFLIANGIAYSMKNSQVLNRSSK